MIKWQPEPTREVIDLEAHPELEPDLGPPQPEGPPADMLSPHAESEIPEPPAWTDELDLAAYGNAERATWAALADTLAAREAANEPEAG
jgi:hypothetical protein